MYLYGSDSKDPPTVQEMQVGSLGWNDALEKEMGTHSSILAWEISWTGSLAGCSPWGGKESDRTEPLTLSLSHTYMYIYIHTHIYMFKDLVSI